MSAVLENICIKTQAAPCLYIALTRKGRRHCLVLSGRILYSCKGGTSVNNRHVAPQRFMRLRHLTTVQGMTEAVRPTSMSSHRCGANLGKGHGVAERVRFPGGIDAVGRGLRFDEGGGRLSAY
jgi:hypothetical protein